MRWLVPTVDDCCALFYRMAGLHSLSLILQRTHQRSCIDNNKQALVQIVTAYDVSGTS